SEMGQGAQTALAQMLADELDANWSDVTFLEAPAEDAYANWALGKGYLVGGASIPSVLVDSVDGAIMQIAKTMHLQITGGSLSVRTTGVYGMRVAGAAARSMLLEAAAESWQVDVTELIAENSHIVHPSSGRREPYAAFATLAGSKTMPRSPQLKTPDQFKIMGTSRPRLDIPAKVDGSAIFGIDAIVEGMKYATVKSAPVFGARVASMDSQNAESLPGVIKVLNLDNAVAVVADGYWQAKKALDAIHVNWTPTDNDNRNTEALFTQFDQDIQRLAEAGDTRKDKELGNSAAAMQSATRIVERHYQVPYLAHACMEPMNALARVSNDQCDIWTGTQNPLGFKYAVAEALGMEAENVHITNHLMGGGFGRRSNPDAVIQAARISKAVGVPVKLIWSREEDMRQDHYRPAVASSFRAALNDRGLPVAWENTYVDKHEPVEAPHIPYAIANQKIHYIDSPTHIPFGPWRSVDHSQHGFFTESFIDELAYEAGEDPYQFRRGLLKDQPRYLAVLDKAASEAGWGKALGKGRGRGIALQNSFGTLVSQVVEVSVEAGEVSVDRVVVAVDPGFAVSPNGLKAQMESGVIFGLTAALYGEINITDGQVVEGNFDNYKMVRMNTAPLIETHIINSLEAWGGAGEPGTPGIAPALTNAIYAATGVRIRKLPAAGHDLNKVRVEEPVEVTGIITPA
ncbi:MAG: molybdopterin-dependent oxidoreductase, partial [Gammaproteobacteria bacterium]|nr:molybdopterin-dependent oxidoreductase [Gammaproteobacteria bacterium]